MRKLDDRTRFERVVDGMMRKGRADPSCRWRDRRDFLATYSPLSADHPRLLRACWWSAAFEGQVGFGFGMLSGILHLVGWKPSTIGRIGIRSHAAVGIIAQDPHVRRRAVRESFAMIETRFFVNAEWRHKIRDERDDLLVQVDHDLEEILEVWPHEQMTTPWMAQHIIDELASRGHGSRIRSQQLLAR